MSINTLAKPNSYNTIQFPNVAELKERLNQI